MSYRDEARRAFESRAAHSANDKYLKQIKHHHPALAPFGAVEELLGLLRDVTANADAKDAALVALLEEYQRGRGGGAFALLALAMFPALDRIYWSRIHRTHERDDLWGRVVEAFAEALDRYPISRRPARVAANIEGETMAALRRAGLRDVRTMIAQERFTAVTSPFLDEIDEIHPSDPDEVPLSFGDFVASGSEPVLPPDEAEVAAAARAMTPLFEEGEINEQDQLLLLGVHLYERTIGDLAREMGISREAAKKRHLRAINRLRALRQKKADRE